MPTVFEILHVDQALPPAVQSALDAFNAIARPAGDAITSRIVERRRASGCAITIASSLNWSDADWSEYYAITSPAMRTLREVCNLAGLSICDILARD